MTTDQMLHKLQFSKNELVAEQAKQMLSGELLQENVKRYCGGFLFAVLDGNYPAALAHADTDNKEALLA